MLGISVGSSNMLQHEAISESVEKVGGEEIHEQGAQELPCRDTASAEKERHKD